MIAHMVKHKDVEDDSLSPPSPFYWIGALGILASVSLLFVVVGVGLF